MKFAKGMLMGGIITAGVLMMYADNNTGKKKIMKKGKGLLFGRILFCRQQSF